MVCGRLRLTCRPAGSKWKTKLKKMMIVKAQLAKAIKQFAIAMIAS